jgi:DNA-binding GntR family transcriptional regulator
MTNQTLGKQAYSEIRDRILGGRLQPGQRLSLRGVASDLGMSMVPVGEALRELARDGLIETEPRWGARVRRLDLESLRNQHVLRTALECEAARQCVERALPAHLDEAMTIAVELDRCVERNEDSERVFELDARFHLRLAQASGFPALAESLRANQLMRLLARGSRIAHGRKDRPARAHQELVEAIRSGDADVAERAMRGHCQASMALQLEWFARAEHAAEAEQAPAPRRRAR